MYIFVISKVFLGTRYHLQVASINPRLLLEVLSEDVGNLDGLRQDTAVGHTLGQVCTGASVLELLEVNMVRDIVPIPVRPAIGVDNIAQLAVLEDNAGVRAPRAAQVRRALAGCPRDRGPVEDVEGGAVVRLAPAGCDVPRPDGLDVAALEPRLGVAAKDEVDGAVDVAVGVELAALVAEDRVLVACPVRQYLFCSCKLA